MDKFYQAIAEALKELNQKAELSQSRVFALYKKLVDREAMLRAEQIRKNIKL